MTDHSKAKAGKAANKNHKVVRMEHAEVTETAKPLPNVAGGKAQKVIANAKIATATMLKNVTTSLHQLQDAGVKAKKIAAETKAATPVKHKTAGTDSHKVSAMVKTGVRKAVSHTAKKAAPKAGAVLKKK
jgi:hypothetical protein